MRNKFCKETINLCALLIKVLIIIFVIDKIFDNYFNQSKIKSLILIGLASVFVYLIDKQVRTEIKLWLKKLKKMSK